MQWLPKDHRRDILASKINIMGISLTLRELLIAMLFMARIQTMRMKRMKMSMMKMIIGRKIIMECKIKIILGLYIRWDPTSRSIWYPLFLRKQWRLHPRNRFITLNSKMTTTNIKVNQNQMICLIIFLWNWAQVRHFKTIISEKSLIWILSTTKKISIITTTF